jgi:hypothetical protein
MPGHTPLSGVSGLWTTLERGLPLSSSNKITLILHGFLLFSTGRRLSGGPHNCVCFMRRNFGVCCIDNLARGEYPDIEEKRKGGSKMAYRPHSGDVDDLIFDEEYDTVSER